MLRQVLGKKIVEMTADDFAQIRAGFEQVVIDLGAGDGKFAYRYAKENPHALVLAIDADKNQLEEVSIKVTKKPAKGGLPNVLCLWHAVTELPAELDQVADQVFINFPWGSLLAGIVKQEPSTLAAIANIAKPGAEVVIYVSYFDKYEPKMIADYQLPVLTSELLNQNLAKAFSLQGVQLELAESVFGNADIATLSTWSKKLINARQTRPVYFVKLHKLNEQAQR
jgi:16S rRNA (adenine(1408)-N(1))-methyltransferase